MPAVAHLSARLRPIQRAARLGGRFLVDSTYRTHVLDVLNDHVGARTSAQVTESESNLRLDGQRIYFIGGCEFSGMVSVLERAGADCRDTFALGRPSDPFVEVSDPESPLWEFSPHAVVLSPMTRVSKLFAKLLWRSGSYPAEEQADDLDEVFDSLHTAVREIRERSHAQVYVMTHPLADRPGLGVMEPRILGSTMGQTELRHELARRTFDLARRDSHCHVLDVDTILAERARADVLEVGTELLGEHFRPEGAALVARRLATMLSVGSASDRSIKVIVVDLDNTLWNGVLREDGPDNVKVMVHRLRALKVMAARGILLAVCSKNDPIEAEYLPGLIGADLYESFVSVKLGWDPKSSVLKAMAAELDIGLDAFAMFDDNPRERAEIEANATDVLVLSETAIVGALARQEFQPLATLSATSFERARLYEQRANRKQAEQTADGDRLQYLHSLDLILDVRRAVSTDRSRVVELLQRTNQLNATQRRSDPMSAGADVFVANAKDRFGDFGLIGIIATCRTAPDTCRVEELAFSCRAMGLGIEQATIATVARDLGRDGVKSLVLDFRATPRNGQLRSLLAESGFSTTGQCGEVEPLTLDVSIATVPDWIEVL